ncbi:MAG: hypothetical protein WAT66_02345 [Actinomycetota bacterium]
MSPFFRRRIHPCPRCGRALRYSKTTQSAIGVGSQTGFANIAIRLAGGNYPSILFFATLCVSLVALVFGVLAGRLEIVAADMTAD